MRFVNNGNKFIMENQLLECIGDNLYISKSDTVQPNVLLRMPLFTPVAKDKLASSMIESDMTAVLQNLELFKREGYDAVKISGFSMNMQTDFKVWAGIVLAFSKYGYNTNEVKLKFSEFLGLCGFPRSRSDSKTRKQIADSLFRIKSQTLSFTKKSAKSNINTGLLLKSHFDYEKDEIILLGDNDLWELYQLDHQILVSLDTLKKVSRSESAQCLYVFFASLPENPIPVTLSRMRERLMLTMVDKEVNRSIRTAIARLESIGYLSGSWTKFNNESAYHIYNRNRKLIGPKV